MGETHLWILPVKSWDIVKKTETEIGSGMTAKPCGFSANESMNRYVWEVPGNADIRIPADVFFGAYTTKDPTNEPEQRPYKEMM